MSWTCGCTNNRGSMQRRLFGAPAIGLGTQRLLHGCYRDFGLLIPTLVEHRCRTLTKRTMPGRSKIDIADAKQVKYWTKALDGSKNDLFEAIHKVGNAAASRELVNGRLQLRRHLISLRAAPSGPVISKR